ncbi:MAG: hypothetical protein M3R27_00755 [Bacteroidota bacterium]|nr:hypothetical protein [Bacteroidota bacterium]
MKKTFLYLAIILSASLFVSCSSAEKTPETPAVSGEQYQCPMKCTEEIFDKPGECPVCGMELEKIANS